MSMPRFGSRLRLLATYLVLGAVAAFEIGYVAHVVRDLTRPDSAVADPFAYDLQQRVTWVGSGSEKAGLHPGDRIVAINGRPFRSDGVFADSLARSHPGDTFSVLARHADGQQVLLALPLRGRYHDIEPLVSILSKVLLPLVCTILSLWLVATRPRDPTAWILLALLTSFSLLVLEPGWDGPFRAAAMLFESVMPETFGIWLLLFAIHFPTLPQWRSRVLAPAVLLIAITAFVVSLDAAIVVTNQIDFSRLAAIRARYAALQIAVNLLLLLSLFVSALILHLKRRYVGPESDFYRRIQLLEVGTSISVGPILLIAIADYVRGSAAPRLPEAVVAPAVCMLLLLPCTFAYVLVVHRALEVREILRDALKRLTENQAKGLGGEFLLVSLTAATLYLSHAAPILTVGIPMALFLVLWRLPVVEPLSSWLDRRLFREHHEAEELLMQTLERIEPLENTEPLLEKLVHRIANAIQVDVVAVLLRRGESYSIRHWTGPENLSGVSIPVGGSLAQLAARTSKPILFYREFYREPDRDASAPDLRSVAGDEQQELTLLRTQVVLPLRGNRELLGMITLGPRRWDRAYSRSDLRLLATLATECGLVIENGELLQRLTREIHDSERKQAEKLAADQASRAKSDLLAQMSHELRTPLNAILGYSEILREEAEEQGAHGMIADLGKIHAAGKHLLAMINSVLDMAKLESGRTELYLEIFALEPLIREVASIAAPLMGRNDNAFHCEIVSGLGAMEADTTKLRQILLNLLSNAAKFTKNGSVTLRVTSDRIDDVGWVNFEVRDTGMGMTEEQVTRLCVPFRQADASIARRFGGTGLGLAISRQFCQLMGGDIVIESHLGQGSVFTVRLPIAVSHYQKRLVAEPPVLRERTATVLVIDDDPVMHDLVGRFFNQLPVRVLACTSGEEGLKYAVEQKPSCIVLDIIMPDKDGWAVLREFKSDARVCAIPIVVSSIIDDRRFAASLGAAGFLCKPLMRRELLEMVLPLIGMEPEPDDSSTSLLPAIPQAVAGTV